MSPLPAALAPLFAKIDRSAVKLDEDRLKQAWQLAQRLYGDRKHWTGVGLLDHVVGVLEILLPFQPDEDTLVACLLSHALEARAVSLDELEEQFGSRVRHFVSAVHLLAHVTMRNRRVGVEDLRLMLVRVSDDIRVLLILLCDQCQALEHVTVPAEKKRIAQDALSLFAPVAARLGMHVLKQRLEGLAFPVVYPADADLIAQQVAILHRQHEDFLPVASQTLAAQLRERGMTVERVEGREKHPYSIFLKMKAKGLSQIDKIHDLYAIRVIVPSVEECYRVLGTLHQLGRPATNRFKDYVAFPKPNGYQSLHTTIAKLPGVPDGLFVEVQIRTEPMHREAEYGIAAHWSYKQGGTTEQTIRRIELHQVLNAQQAVEVGKGSALADHIFVLTPKGDIVELPEGATPLDFAFQIHSDLGLRFKAARVNGGIVPINEELENGDVVEVLTHPSPRPSAEWMQLLKMHSSRSRLKHYLYSLHRDVYVDRGRVLLNEELKKRGVPPLDPDLSLLRVVDDHALSHEEREDMLMKIGQGSERAASVCLHLPIARRGPAWRPTGAARLQRKDSVLELEGGVPMPIRFAKCCKAQEAHAKPIVGVITRTGEVVVHRAECKMHGKANPERRIGVRWRSN